MHSKQESKSTIQRENEPHKPNQQTKTLTFRIDSDRVYVSLSIWKQASKQTKCERLNRVLSEIKYKITASTEHLIWLKYYIIEI